MALAAGAKVDSYEVLGLLGAGGMGEVYRARDPVLKREVAIKVLPSFVSQDPDRLHRFEQEAQAAAALNHPNILAVHQFGVFQGAPYLVSELLEGHTLRQLLQHGLMPVRKAIDYGVQIAHGLAAAHEKGIVHRDLKPENLFVTKDGRVKILDFGLAKLMQHHPEPDGLAPTMTPTMTQKTDPGMVMGTAGYMSPEQVRGKTVDHRTDIFAFGAILYEMLTGKRAFQRSTSAETMTAILNDDPPGISQIVQTTPRGLQRVVHRCLEKNPEQRFQSASDLAFALDALSAASNSDSFPVAGTAGWLPDKGAKKKLVIGLCALLLICVSLGALFYARSKSPSAGAPGPRLVHKQITFVGNAFEPAISPDGKSVAYVTKEPGRDDRLMIQAVNGGPGIELLHAYYLARPTWSPDGAEIALSSNLSLSGSRVLQVLSRLGGTPRLLGIGVYSCWSPDGSQILATNENRETGMYWKNKLTGEYKKIPAPPYQWLMDVDCSAKTGMVLLLTNTSDKYDLWIMKPDGTAQRKLLAGEKKISSPRWSQSGDSVYYFRKDGDTTDLMMVRVSGPSAESSVLASGLEAGDFFTISADGSQVAYTRTQNYSNLWLAELPSHGATDKVVTRPLTSGTLVQEDPSLSPDGRWVVFTIGSGQKNNVYKMPSNGGQQVQLTFFDSATSSSPAWSPDGRRIAFICDQGGIARIWLVDADGNAAHTLDKTNATDTNDFVSWFPNPQIIYALPGLHNLRLLNAESQEEKPLLPHDSEGWFPFRPVFSPDGEKIAILWNQYSAPLGVWIISLKDHSEKLLYGGWYSPFGWSPDGKFVYATTQSDPREILQIPLENPKESKPVITMPQPVFMNDDNHLGGTVSPDGRTIIVSLAENKSDVWIMENFDSSVGQTKQSPK